MDVKELIKRRRKELGLTLLEVAKACGVSEGTVSRWESGEIENMKRDKVIALARVLKIDPAVIMGWEKPGYYFDPESASLAQEMLDDPDMRALFDMKRNMDPERFRAHMEFMKTLYKQEHPNYDEGC